MDDDGEEESKKTKKTSETSEEDDDEGQEAEDYAEMESFGEAFESKTDTADASCVPPSSDFLSSEKPETEAMPTSVTSRGSYEERRRHAMKLKWMSVTGKKPLRIPVTKRYQAIDRKEGPPTSFFGDRRPAEIEEKRKETWMKLQRTYQTEILVRNEGRILQEIRHGDVMQGLCCLRFSPTAEDMVTSFGNGSVQVCILSILTLIAIPLQKSNLGYNDYFS